MKTKDDRSASVKQSNNERVYITALVISCCTLSRMAVNVWSPNIEDKVFLVTGGAAGVGAAVVRRLLAENARVKQFLVHKILLLFRLRAKRKGIKFLQCSSHYIDKYLFINFALSKDNYLFIDGLSCCLVNKLE